ncbi:hypothetical protein ACHAXN_006398 [Cyclotella atomus]|jgi:hypothetical protein
MTSGIKNVSLAVKDTAQLQTIPNALAVVTTLELKYIRDLHLLEDADIDRAAESTQSTNIIVCALETNVSLEAFRFEYWGYTDGTFQFDWSLFQTCSAICQASMAQ